MHSVLLTGQRGGLAHDTQWRWLSFPLSQILLSPIPGSQELFPVLGDSQSFPHAKGGFSAMGSCLQGSVSIPVSQWEHPE